MPGQTVEAKNLFKTIEQTSKQARFAAILALTRVAKNAQGEVKKSLDKKFKLRNKWTAGGIRIKPALKTDKPEPYAEVFSRDWYIAHHEAGAKRRVPKELKAFWIFGKEFDTLTGQSFFKVPAKKYRAGQILKTRIGGKLPFKTRTMKSGQEIIAVRRAKSGRSIGVLYILEDEPVKIEERSWFEPVVDKAYDETFQKEYESALAFALRTAL